jgi:hypothetical protein
MQRPLNAPWRAMGTTMGLAPSTPTPQLLARWE